MKKDGQDQSQLHTIVAQVTGQKEEEEEEDPQYFWPSVYLHMSNYFQGHLFLNNHCLKKWGRWGADLFYTTINVDCRLDLLCNNERLQQTCTIVSLLENGESQATEQHGVICIEIDFLHRHRPKKAHYLPTLSHKLLYLNFFVCSIIPALLLPATL